MIKKLIAVLCVFGLLAAGYAGAESAMLIKAPGGAPALAVAALGTAEPDCLQTVGADAIAAEFGKEEADFIIAPVNAGAKLFKAGKSTYRLAAVVTWGNLVFASQAEGFTPESMNGKKVTLFGENTINASVALYVMEQKGITPAETEYLATAAATQTLLTSDAEAIVLTAEPAATAATMKNDKITIIPLNDLLKEITGDEGFAQAGLFVREKTIQEKPEEVKEWLEKIRASADQCAENVESTAANAVALEILANEKVAQIAIPKCGIRYVAAAEAREQIEKTANIDLSQYGGAVPADEFYFEAE